MRDLLLSIDRSDLKNGSITLATAWYKGIPDQYCGGWDSSRHGRRTLDRRQRLLEQDSRILRSNSAIQHSIHTCDDIRRKTHRLDEFQ
jgi:hypothetical protein